jgi:F5/8 type C domain
MKPTQFSAYRALLGAVLVCLSSCSSGESHGSTVVDTDPMHGLVPIGDGCSTPNEGCPCTSEETTAKCAETVSHSANIITCREGVRTCAAGTWGACIGDGTREMYAPAPAAPGAQEQGLGVAKSCMDKCDPYCQTLADTPDDLQVDKPLATDAGGITLYSDGYTGSNCPDVRITPAAATLTIKTINDDGTVLPNGVDLVATCGAVGTQITPSWSTDQPDRSAVNLANTLKVFSGVAGDINVTASSLLDTGTSVVTVKVDINDVTGISTAVQTALDAPGTAADPGKTLYPYKNTVFPLDLTAPLVQWQTGGTPAANVQVALRYPAGSTTPSFWYAKIFAGEPNQGTVQATGAPSWQIPQAVWTALARTAKGKNAEIVIQRTTGATTYREMTIPVTFSTASLRGTVYYTQYLRRLYKADGSNLCSGQANLPMNYNPVAPGGAVCPVGTCTHAEDVADGSATRAIDMSTPTATNQKPFGNKPGCPVCHSVSANGNVYVSGSAFLQTWAGGTSTGFVDSIGTDSAGMAKFTVIGEAPNYSSFRTSTDWLSRGFGYAALTPDGALALQGFYTWGNTQDGTVSNNMSVDRTLTDGGQAVPMFFVPTAVNGANVKFATTTALAASRSGNVLTANSAGVLPSIDGMTLAVGDSLLVKDQAIAADNGIYTVTKLGSSVAGTSDLTTSVGLTATTSSVNGTNSGNTAAKAFDNDASSRWETEWTAGPHWLQVDLGSSKPITGVTILWEAANARDYKVQGSNDAATWTDMSTQTGVGGATARTDTLTGLTGTYRYVRVYCTLRNNIYGYSIFELDVFGPTSGTPYQLTRRIDAQTPALAEGTIKANWEVRVTRGTANYAKVFKLTAPTVDPVINTDGLTFGDTGADALPVMMTPTISKDGTKLAYVNGSQDTIGADSTAWRKGLTVVDFDQATRKISNKKRILNNWDGATGGAPINWPFFEPDSRSLLYVQSTTTNYCSSESTASNAGKACKESVYGNSAPTSRGYWPGSLYSIDAGAATPASTKAELSKLNDAEDTADADKAYQPTVLPFSSGGFRWVIFTSPRSYGNQINQIGTDFSCGAAMLWVAAVDDATANGTDRSHPAFFLPGQNVRAITGQAGAPEHFINERGYLVPSPCKATGISCSTGDECCGGTECRVDTISASGTPNNKCKDPLSCSNVGGACLTSADCCGGAPCTAQKCQNLPSYAAPGTYVRTYEASCEAGFKPRWGLFLFHLTTASSSRIGFSVKTAVTNADLAMAPSVDLGDSTKDNFGGMADSRDVGALLEAAKQPYSSAILQVSMKLYPSADGAVAPILHDWEQRYTCEPAE